MNRIAERGRTFQMYDMPESSNQGSCLKCMRLRNPKKESVLQMYDETLWPNEGGVFKIYDEPLSPSLGTCVRYMMHIYRQMSGRV